ncbi:hypothetical protein HY02_03820 [Peptococcaceae bacterium SCADC1_2_3]|nr:hypothetical protein HY02_03820 [Peptococcaceae bacterium SCADC1_2_3]
MYPQTHVYFAEKVFGRLSEPLALGSVFPDIAQGIVPDRQKSHGCGAEILTYMREQDNDEDLLDFARGVITHGIKPAGLDYYGDEKFLSYERGYCFEKGRVLIDETIKACRLPPTMGWWKTHNIVEMGIELHLSNFNSYGKILSAAFVNIDLLTRLSQYLGHFYAIEPALLKQRILRFAGFIEISQVTAASLAARYDLQMFAKHHLHIDIPHVAHLIKQAITIVTDDLTDFFTYVLDKVKHNLITLHAID